jgi:hypothetical protein
MHKNNDVNQVSMSSIEPAAVSTTAHHAALVSGGIQGSKSQPDQQNSGKSAPVKGSAKKINEASEREDSEEGPPSDQDELENRIDVNDIPEFTIGPGALGASPPGHSKDLNSPEGGSGYVLKSGGLS